MGTIVSFPSIQAGMTVATAAATTPPLPVDPVTGKVITELASRGLLNVPDLEEFTSQLGEIIGTEIREAIREEIVIPFCEGAKALAINAWQIFVELSFIAAVLASLIGILCAFGGIQRGKKIVYISIILFILIKAMSAIMGI